MVDEILAGRIQAVSATSSANFSDGFIYPSVLRGRPLSMATKKSALMAMSGPH